MINNFRFQNIETLIFCGDIHGEFETVVYKLNQYDNAVLIICGDIGMGFHKDEYYYTLFKKLNGKLSKQNNYLLLFKGNHDDPTFFSGLFKKHPHIHLIADYSVISANQTNVLCVGGATSIDRKYRVEAEQRTGNKSYWEDAELPYYDSEKLNIINQQFADAIHIVATHTAPSFAYPTSKASIATWIASDEGLNDLLDKERVIMDQLFANLQKFQPNITDWYYGHFHEHKLEQHNSINFRLCDCGEINEFRKFDKM